MCLIQPADYLSTLIVSGERMTVLKNDSAFQQQAIFAFSTKTSWGSKVDSYDCRALLSDAIATTPHPIIRSPDERLQIERFGTLLMHLGEGSSTSDILEWASDKASTKKLGGISAVMAPTQFEEEKQRLLGNASSEPDSSAPNVSLTRLSNQELDKIASMAGIANFSKRTYRENVEQEFIESYQLSRGDRKAHARERKRYQLHLSDKDDQTAQKGHPTQTPPKKGPTDFSFEIETSPAEDTIILDDHWSSPHLQHQPLAMTKKNAWQAADDPHKSVPSNAGSTDIFGRDLRRQTKLYEAQTTLLEERTSQETTVDHTETLSSRRSPPSRSPPRSRGTSSSPKRRDYGFYNHRDERRYDRSPPMKRSKGPDALRSESKLDRALAALEAKKRS
jgi:hypothetical protein